MGGSLIPVVKRDPWHQRVLLTGHLFTIARASGPSGTGIWWPLDPDRPSRGGRCVVGGLWRPGIPDPTTCTRSGFLLWSTRCLALPESNGSGWPDQQNGQQYSTDSAHIDLRLRHSCSASRAPAFTDSGQENTQAAEITQRKVGYYTKYNQRYRSLLDGVILLTRRSMVVRDDVHGMFHVKHWRTYEAWSPHLIPHS